MLVLLMAQVHAADIPALPESPVEAHLIAVEAALRDAATDHLSAEAQAERARLLDALHAYHLSGAFPQPPPGTQLRPRPVPVVGGYSASGATPWFVDAEGRACAVGHLLQVSGHTALVDAVVASDNGAWLHDLHSPALATAGAEMGFSLDELARIQPSYFVPKEQLPPIPVSLLEGGCTPRSLLPYIRENEADRLPEGWDLCVTVHITTALAAGRWTPAAEDALLLLGTWHRAHPPGTLPWLADLRVAAVQVDPTHLPGVYARYAAQSGAPQADLRGLAEDLEGIAAGHPQERMIRAQQIRVLRILVSQQPAPTPDAQARLLAAECALTRLDAAPRDLPPACVEGAGTGTAAQGD